MRYDDMTRSELIQELRSRDHADREYPMADESPDDTGMTADDYQEMFARMDDIERMDWEQSH